MMSDHSETLFNQGPPLTTYRVKENPKSLSGDACTTETRPTHIPEGKMIFDTTIGKPIWAKVGGSEPVWVNASGERV